MMTTNHDTQDRTVAHGWATMVVSLSLDDRTFAEAQELAFEHVLSCPECLAEVERTLGVSRVAIVAPLLEPFRQNRLVVAALRARVADFLSIPATRADQDRGHVLGEEETASAVPDTTDPARTLAWIGEHLHGPDPWLREAAVTALTIGTNVLAVHDPGQVVSYLDQLVQDPDADWTERYAAAHAIADAVAALANHNAVWMQRMLDLLVGDPDEEVRGAAQEALLLAGNLPLSKREATQTAIRSLEVAARQRLQSIGDAVDEARAAFKTLFTLAPRWPDVVMLGDDDDEWQVTLSVSPDSADRGAHVVLYQSGANPVLLHVQPTGWPDPPATYRFQLRFDPTTSPPARDYPAYLVAWIGERSAAEPISFTAEERYSAVEVARPGRSLRGAERAGFEQYLAGLQIDWQVEESESPSGSPQSSVDSARGGGEPASPPPVTLLTASMPAPGVEVRDRAAMATMIEAGLVVAVPEFADDQMATREQLDQFFVDEVARVDPVAQAVLAPWTGREFRRALINGELLPINRAYLVNNAALFGMYQHDDANREGMVALLASGAVVPFLLKEHDPLAAPQGLRLNATGLEAWLGVARAARDSGGITAIRLAHDDELNDRLLFQLLTQRFQGLAAALATRDVARLADDLGLRTVLKDDLLPLSDLLYTAQELAGDLSRRRRSADGRTPGSMSRTDFYLAFVSSVPEDARYDGGALIQDPERVLADRDWARDWAPRFRELQARLPLDVRRACARGLKELIDLVYNTNVPDALGGYGLSPQGALPRSALQELSLAIQQAGGQERIRAKEILEMVRREAFSKVMERLAAPEIASLSLAQIAQVRQTDAWRDYVGSLRGLLQAPANFGEEAAAVFAAYQGMVRSAVPRGQVIVPLEPLPKMLIQIDAATIEVMWTGDRVVWEQRGRVSEAAPVDRAQLSLQFGIGDRRGGADLTGWTTMTEFHRGAIANPAGAVRTIVEALERGSDYHPTALVDVERPPVLDKQAV